MIWYLLKRLDVWGIIIGVAGFAFGIYTFYHAEKTGRISYAISTQKIFDPGNFRGFTLIAADGMPVEDAVFASDVVIWNSGDLSESSDANRVREPIKAELSDGIFRYYVLGAVNIVGSDNYTIDISPDQRHVTIAWKFFDPGQGVRLTLVHSAKNSIPKISLVGRFFETSLAEQRALPPTVGFVIGVLISTVAIIFVAITYPRLRAVFPSFPSFPLLVMIPYIIVAAAGLLITIMLIPQSTPPV